MEVEDWASDWCSTSNRSVHLCVCASRFVFHFRPIRWRRRTIGRTFDSVMLSSTKEVRGFDELIVQNQGLVIDLLCSLLPNSRAGEKCSSSNTRLFDFISRGRSDSDPYKPDESSTSQCPGNSCNSNFMTALSGKDCADNIYVISRTRSFVNRGDRPHQYRIKCPSHELIRKLAYDGRMVTRAEIIKNSFKIRFPPLFCLWNFSVNTLYNFLSISVTFRIVDCKGWSFYNFYYIVYTWSLPVIRDLVLDNSFIHQSLSLATEMRAFFFFESV